MAFAAKTKVPVEKTKTELQTLLLHKGATRTSFDEDIENGLSSVRFIANNRLIRFDLRLPQRPANGRREAYEQACRQRWRALLLCIKAKFEAIDSDIASFDSEFLAQTIVDSEQRTAAETMLPTIEKLYSSDGPLKLTGPVGR